MHLPGLADLAQSFARLPAIGQGGSLHAIRYRMHPSGDFTYEVLHTLLALGFSLSPPSRRGEAK